MHLNDFPDRLSPMLVKELRQGLRTRSFVAVFLTLQALLAIILLFAGTAAESDHAGNSISNIIFTFSSIAVLVIQPMRGISALSSEIKGNTIDMMVLTRLSAWRIVMGKWAAIVTQSALILVTIIPYLILRYFFGGMNLQGEVVLLALIFLTSCTLTAITIGLSASGSALLRAMVPMIGLPVAAYMILVFFTFGGGTKNLIETCSLETESSRLTLSLYLATCIYAGFFLLSTGTSLIATHAENHSTLRRSISLAVALLAAVICSTALVDPQAVPIAMGLILTPVFALSLTEFAPLSPPVHSEFARFGIPGRISGIFLLPGWPSGVFFCLLLTLIALIPFCLNPFTYDSEEFTIASLAALGTLLFPAVLISAFRMKGPLRISAYILFGSCSCILALVLLTVAESMSNRDFLWLFVWIPPVQFTMLGSTRFDTGAVLIAALVIDICFFAFLLLLAQYEYRRSVRSFGKSLEDGRSGDESSIQST